MFNFLRKKQYCPFCKDSDNDIITLSNQEFNKYNFPAHKVLEKRNSKINLIIDEDYKIYRCRNCKTLLLINSLDVIRVNDKINFIKKWYEGYSDVKLDIKNTIKEIGAKTFNEFSSFIVPCKIRTGIKEYHFTTLVIAKYLPIYHLLYLNKHLDSHHYFFIDEIDDLSPSKYALSKEIRTTKINIEEINNYYPTVLEDNKGQKVLIEGGIFFNSDNIIGSDLKLVEQNWNKNDNYIKDYTTKNNALLFIRSKNGIDF